jgi:hypothetical protein
MPSPQRQSRLYALAEHCRSHINMLTEEVELILNHPVFVPGHGKYFEELELKLDSIAYYQGILAVIDSDFKD